jgi:cytochrome P450
LIRRFIGDSLFVAEGDVHRHLRKTLQPFFSFRKIRDLRPIFWEKGIKLTQAVIESAPRNSGHESTVEVSMWANKATMDSIGEAALGKDFNTLNETNELIEAVEMVGTTKIGLQMVFIATAMFLPRWALSLVPGGIEQRLSAASSRFRQLCTDFINDSKKRVHGGADAKDIFGQIIQSDYFDDHDLIDNLLMIIATG